MTTIWLKKVTLACTLFALVCGITLVAAPQQAVAADAPAATTETKADEHGHAADHGSHATDDEITNPMALKPELALWTGLVFLLLLLILSKFAWGPIVSGLDAREKRISDQFAAAEAHQAEAKALLSQYESKLASAADQVRQLLEEARRDAEHTKTQILAEAKASAQAEQDRALREVRNAKDAALKEIGETGADYAIGLAAQIVGRELKSEDHNRLIRDSLAQLPSNN